MSAYECYNCEKDFEEPIIIDGEAVCPYCYSGDNSCDIEEYLEYLKEKEEEK